MLAWTVIYLLCLGEILQWAIFELALTFRLGNTIFPRYLSMDKLAMQMQKYIKSQLNHLLR